MGRLFFINLEGTMYRCKFCKVHLAISRDIVSKSFHYQNGKVYLMEKVVNVTFGNKEEGMIMTGIHTVVAIFCIGCGNIVGCKYIYPQERSQEYKEGKFILDKFKVLGPDGSGYTIIKDVGGSDDDE